MIKFVLMLVMLLLLGCVKLFRQNWTSPAGMNMLINIFFVFFAVIVFGSDLEWHYAGIWWMLVSCLLFLAGQTIGGRIKLNTSYMEKTGKDGPVSNMAYVMVLILTFMCFGISVLVIVRNGFQIAEIFQIAKLLEINNTIAQRRYIEGAVSLGFVGNMLLVISYFITLLGGYLYIYAKNTREKVICYFVFCPTIAQMLIQNTKLSLISDCFFWASGYLVAYHAKSGNKKLLSGAMMRRLFVAGIACLVLLDLVMMLRIGEISIDAQRIVSDKFQIYAFGSIYSFSYWFDIMGELPYDLGANTYMVFPRWLGLTDRIQGVYELIDGLQSNIYTVNRGIITDFGVIGGLVYWHLLGCVSGVLYKAAKYTRIRENLIIKVLLASIYFFVFFGFMVSPWVYTSLFLAFMLFVFALVIIKYFNISIRGK